MDFTFFIKRPAVAALNTCIALQYKLRKSQKNGTAPYYCEGVKYFATDVLHQWEHRQDVCRHDAFHAAIEQFAHRIRWSPWE